MFKNDLVDEWGEIATELFSFLGPLDDSIARQVIESVLESIEEDGYTVHDGFELLIEACLNVLPEVLESYEGYV